MSSLQKLYTGRVNQTAEVDSDTGNIGNTFVGEIQRLWYNPDDNSIYVSDGNTPGGILVAGASGGNPFNQNLNTYNSPTFVDLTLTGNLNTGNTATINLGNLSITDETITGLINNRSIDLAPGGNGTVKILNAMEVHTGNFQTTPLFSVSTTGVVSTIVPTGNSLIGAFEIVGNEDGNTVAPQNSGVMLHTTGQHDTPSRIYNDGVNAYGVLINRRYNGTSASPTGVLTNQIIGRTGATPYLSTGTWPAVSTARLDFVSTDNQSATAQGTQIQMWTVPHGSNVITLNAQFDSSGILLTGNVIPTTTNIYSLGNTTNKWGNLHIGPDSLFIEDSVLGTDAELTVEDGILFINGAERVQIGNMQMTTTGISLVATSSDQNIIVGQGLDTGYTEFQNVGIQFRDGTQQTTAAIPLTQKGNAFGVVPLNAAVKIDPVYLPAGSISFQGIWNANTNTPALADGIGSVGDEWIVGTAGTQDLGSGNITFAVGDFVLYTSANVWEDVPVGGTGVSSFNTRTGAVTLQSGDVTNALSNSSIVNSKLVNSTFTVTTGDGLAGGQVVPLGGSITLTNTGVRNALAGTGVGVSAATGNVTFSIGQPVGTANSVQFLAVSATQTVQATGNITGGNINTSGNVTAAYVKTASTIINNGIVSTGNITGGNLIATAAVSAVSVVATGNVTAGNLTVVGKTNLNAVGNITITGGNTGDRLRTDGAGNLTWVAPAGNTYTYVGANTTVNIDFTFDSISLVYLPTGPVTVNLGNYSPGHSARVLVRYGTPYPLNTGVANASQSTDGTITIPISGAGGHKITGQQTVQLVYTCFDSTAGNCYVAATFL